MRVLGLLVFSLCLGACITNMPQTSEEFKKLVRENPSWYLTESYKTKRNYDEVTNTLKAKWDECYSVSRTTTRSKGGMRNARYTDTYHPKLRKINNSTSELILQMTTEGMVMLNKVPSGGFYEVSLVMKRLPGNNAELVWYSANGWKDQWAKNKKWSEGNNVACE